MLRSMTGFGRAKYETEGREYVIEIKSVNNRYSDVSVRMPKIISYAEESIKKEVLKNISRGKIDINITFNNSSALGKKVTINGELANMYIEELKKISQINQIRDDISVINIAKMPDVLEIKNEDDEEKIIEEIQIPLKQALESFINMRKTEGEKLAEDIVLRIEKISKEIEVVSKYSNNLIEEYIVKLETRIKELLKTEVVDKSRLEQEVVIYADKCSIQEEIIRLKSHIQQFKNLVESNEDSAVGKKLDFIIQEMNRETNTIGSKANCLEITNAVIEMKTEIENIREQIQNIE